jgi:hypothetical protein
MIAGRKDRFAIEAEPEEIVDGWVLGKFRFWLCGHAVGDWDDTADLKGCVGWLRDFVSKPRDRFEASLERASPEEVFREVYDPVMAGATRPALIDDAYGRFHIAHLGMSAFENFDILLLKEANGGERCLWRRAGSAVVHECYLWRNEMESVATDFCDLFEREVSKRP